MINEINMVRSNPVVGIADKIAASLDAIVHTMPPVEVAKLQNPNIRTESGLRDAIGIYALSQVIEDDNSMLRVPLTALVVDSFHDIEDGFRRTPDGKILMLDEAGHFVASNYPLRPAKKEGSKVYREVEYLTGPRRNEGLAVHVSIPSPHEGQVTAAASWVDKPFVSPEVV